MADSAPTPSLAAIDSNGMGKQMNTHSRLAARAALFAIVSTACSTPIMGTDVGNDASAVADAHLLDAPNVVDAVSPNDVTASNDAATPDARLDGGCMPGVFGSSNFGSACFQ